MELEDLKNEWNIISNNANQHASLNPAMINQITRNKYNSKLKKVIYPEIFGILVCLIAAIYVIANFQYLNTNATRIAGVAFIALLGVLSAISLAGIRQLSIPKDMNKTYAETLRLFAQQRIRFLKLQKINITLGYLLLVLTIVLFSKLFSDSNIGANKYFWLFSFTFGYIFLLFYSKWVFSAYKKSLQQAQELLQEVSV